MSYRLCKNIVHY